VEGNRCAAAVYSRPGECFILVGNLDDQQQSLHCAVRAAQLPFPLTAPTQASVIARPENEAAPLDLSSLLQKGVEISVPAESAVVVHLR